MVRLGQYMEQLATILGEFDRVHFDRLERGSTKVIARLDAGQTTQRVQSRVRAVRDGTAPRDALGAYYSLQDMVEDDGGRARLQFRSATILRFTGRNAPPPSKFRLIDTGTVTGRLYHLTENRDGKIKGRIRPRVGNYVNCTAGPELAGELRRHLFEDVRLSGSGTWHRSDNGGWWCPNLAVTKVQPVKNASLRDALDAIRSVEANWSDDPLATWSEIEEPDNDDRKDGTA